MAIGIITPRNTIYKALFALTAGVTWVVDPEAIVPVTAGFITRSRRVKLFSDVPMPQQPAIFQAEHLEMMEQKTNLPYKRVYNAKWIVYQATGVNKNIAGAVANDQILDALQLALRPVPSDPGFQDNRNTLGGLVYHCFMDGEVFKDPGDIDDQAMMVIGLKMLVP